MKFAGLVVFATQCWAQLQQPLVFDDATESQSRGGHYLFDESFDNFVQECIDHFKVPGLSISVVNGMSISGKGYGFARLPSTPATASTLYYTGSTTKSFTAAAILKLVEDTANSTSPIRLTTPVSDLIDFVLPDDYASRHATLEDLLCHRTGMPRHDKSYGGDGFDLEEMVHNLRNLPMTAELRSRWQYCNMMFCALSLAVERVTGAWLGDTLRDWFWRPLGMNETFFRLADAQKAVATAKTAGDDAVKLAVGYSWNNSTRKYFEEEYLREQALISGAGATISSVMDYGRYLRALIHRDTRILSAASYAELRTPRIFDGLPASPASPWVLGAYGLGWQFNYYRGSILQQHGGSVFGFGSLMGYIPELQAGLAVMGNSDETSNLVCSLVAMEWLQRLHAVPADERLDLRAAVDAMLAARELSLRNAVPALYPTLPAKRIPPSLPLAEYAGTFRNVGYGELDFALAATRDLEHLQGVVHAEHVLHADVANRTWRHALELEHVGGEHFVCWIHRADQDTFASFNVFKAEFRVGADGRVAQLGLRYDPNMEPEDKVWFDKVA